MLWLLYRATFVFVQVLLHETMLQHHVVWISNCAFF